jgi:uncharacterized membrane protein
VNVVTHANDIGGLRLKKRVAGTHSRLAAGHGCLARGARRYVMTAWLPTWAQGSCEGFPARDWPRLHFRIVCVVVLLAYHISTEDHRQLPWGWRSLSPWKDDVEPLPSRAYDRWVDGKN